MYSTDMERKIGEIAGNLEGLAWFYSSQGMGELKEDAEEEWRQGMHGVYCGKSVEELTGVLELFDNQLTYKPKEVTPQEWLLDAWTAEVIVEILTERGVEL